MDIELCGRAASDAPLGIAEASTDKHLLRELKQMR